MSREQIAINKIKEQGLLPLFYHDEVELCLSVTNALYEAGVRCIEFTNRGSKALDNFSALVKVRNTSMPDLLLAVGTVKTGKDAVRFADAGADILISPIFDKEVCDAAYLNKLLWIPGCMTPTEIHVAQQAGCKLIKLFPGNVLTPGFIDAIRPLFTDIDYVVTGGVDTSAENLKAWFKTGIAGVGMGSKLITNEVLTKKDFAALRHQTKEVLTLIRQLRIN